MKPEDFFAPRPKLSWRLHVIRTGALLAAVFIAIGFFMLEMFALGGGFFGPGPATLQDKVFMLIVPTLVQIALLLLCWRCWLLHRWACMVMAVLLLNLPPLASSAMLIPHWGNVPGGLAAACMAGCIGAEWRNLKSGF